MTEILVTGAGGFVGQRLVRALAAAEFQVRALTHAYGDIADPATFSKLSPADHVFHLAARTYVPDSWKYPTAFHRTNVIGTACTIDYCRQHGAALTFVSSYLYGAPDHLPIDEQAPVRIFNPYALSKHLAEQLCAFHAETTGQPVNIVRPFNIYGPGQRDDFLIPKIIAQVRTAQSIKVENLEPRRDYLYVDDFVAGLVATLQSRDGYRVFNFGSGRSLSVREVIDTIQSVAQTNLPVTSEEKVRPNEIADICADTRWARSQLGWHPRTSFADGIRSTVMHGS